MSELTKKEQGIVAIVRYNKIRKLGWVNMVWDVGPWRIKYEKRPVSDLWGRFGGGWQWEVGICASTGFRTVIVNLLVCSVRITRRKR